MLPWLTDRFGNPSGSHRISRAARQAVDEARDLVGAALGVDPGDVVFTGSGTEADNLAVTGSFRARGGTLVCTAVEHHAVLHACQAEPGRFRIAGVDHAGQLDLDSFGSVLGPDVSVVSVMLANNEVGTILDLAAAAKLVRDLAPDAVLHTDAVQAFPWVDVASAAEPADLIAISAHKFGGPQGVGALAVRKGSALAPIIHGGGQERERRSGTHNVAGIVGLAAAVEATVASRDNACRRVAGLRDLLADGLLAAVPDAVETGDRAAKIPGNCHLRFAGVESEALLILLDQEGICASAGSACASGAMEPSHVLTAMGIPAGEALGSLRLSLGPTTTDVDIDRALQVIPAAVAHLREA
jgi:cysteine desulfurase